MRSCVAVADDQAVDRRCVGEQLQRPAYPERLVDRMPPVRVERALAGPVPDGGQPVFRGPREQARTSRRAQASMDEGLSASRR